MNFPLRTRVVSFVAFTSMAMVSCSNGPNCPPPSFVSNGRCVTNCHDVPGACGMDAGDVVDASASVCGADAMSCGDACVNVASDPANCGACGHACAGPAQGGHGVCNAGTCAIACDTGWIASGGGCDVAPPRPVMPFSLGFVTSNRPRFRWVLPAGVDGARVEICSDRACMHGQQVIDAAGDHAGTLMALPAGVHFWRLHGRIGSTLGTLTSPVWEFTTAGTTGSTSDGALFDMNGDGNGDLIVGAPASSGTPGRALVFFGSTTGLPAAPSLVLQDSSGFSSFGAIVGNAGDVDGDGFADATSLTSQSGLVAVALFAGGAGATGTNPQTVLSAPTNAEMFGVRFSGVGDVNGDGYGDAADAAIASFDSTHHVGHLFVYAGSASGLPTTPSTTIDGPDGPASSFGLSLAALGDVDGDGFEDVGVGGGPAAYIFWGSALGLQTMNVTPLHNINEPGLQHVIRSAGDLNGDGFPDVLVLSLSTTGTGCADAFLGGGSHAFAVPAEVCGLSDVFEAGTGVVGGTGSTATRYANGNLMASGTASSRAAGYTFPAGGAAIGDVTGDGAIDLVLSGVPQSTGGLVAYVGLFSGAATGSAQPAIWTFDAPAGSVAFGRAVAGCLACP